MVHGTFIVNTQKLVDRFQDPTYSNTLRSSRELQWRILPHDQRGSSRGKWKMWGNSSYQADLWSRRRLGSHCIQVICRRRFNPVFHKSRYDLQRCPFSPERLERVSASSTASSTIPAMPMLDYRIMTKEHTTSLHWGKSKKVPNCSVLGLRDNRVWILLVSTCACAERRGAEVPLVASRYTVNKSSISTESIMRTTWRCLNVMVAWS